MVEDQNLRRTKRGQNLAVALQYQASGWVPLVSARTLEALGSQRGESSAAVGKESRPVGRLGRFQEWTCLVGAAYLEEGRGEEAFLGEGRTQVGTCQVAEG